MGREKIERRTDAPKKTRERDEKDDLGLREREREMVCNVQQNNQNATRDATTI